MVIIEKVDTKNKKQVRRFIELPHRIYAGNKQWVPPLNIDAYMQLDRKKHPFHEHSVVDFFLAVKDGRDVGRIAAIENKPFNEYHKKKEADFYFFECEDDMEAATALFNAVFDWAKARGLNQIVGPKGMGVFDGYGILILGYEERQTMNMLNYNHAYYRNLVEAQGFEKEMDFVTTHLPSDKLEIPERVTRITEKVMQRGSLEIKNFKDKNDFRLWADRIAKTYNRAFVENWEYYPLSKHEIDLVTENLLSVADYRLIKLITRGEEVVGFIAAFYDVSAAMQRSKGKLFPFGLIDLLLEMRRTTWVTINGVGVLPEFQGAGGNALLYYAIGKALLEVKDARKVDMTKVKVEMAQVAESAGQMSGDLQNLNGVEYKRHRVYRKKLESHETSI